MIEYERKFKQVQILGLDVFIAERDAFDILQLHAFAKKLGKQTDLNLFFFQAGKVVVDALKENYRRLKWFEIIRWIKLKRTLRVNNILRKLPESRIVELFRLVHELEGVNLEDAEKKSLIHSPTMN